MVEPIRIFIGTEPKTYIAQRVLEHSIRTNTDHPVEITPMIGPAWEYPLDGIKVGTGFSLRRWMIPAACGWQGKAIYMDADQLVFGDVAEIYRYKHAVADPVIGCTWQKDKYSPNKDVPQTAVMWIDCEKAKLFDLFKIDGILEYLRANTTAKDYGRLMHAEWLDKRVDLLPTAWNHLNVYEPKRTRLLHYTKEPEQPWYKPDHPLAGLWQRALQAAMADGYVTVDDVRAALSKWSVKEDWRNTNGLHPHYRRFLLPNNRAPSKPKSARVLWVTTFGTDMFEPSGKPLLQSFVKHQCGHMLVATEGVAEEEIKKISPNFLHHELQSDSFLSDWLKANADVIPQHLGGTHDGVCRCPGGPFDVHDKRHKMPCIGHWFDRNASRWFRKIAAQRAAVAIAELNNYDYLIWVDADCQFKAAPTLDDVKGFFKGKNAAFYLKNRRPIMESGILGFDLRRGGQQLIRDVVECYRSGAFRKMKRWDDSAVYQWFFDRTKLPVVDIAKNVGDHAAVVPHSPLNAFMVHDKGKHGRGLGIMK